MCAGVSRCVRGHKPRYIKKDPSKYEFEGSFIWLVRPPSSFPGPSRTLLFRDARLMLPPDRLVFQPQIYLLCRPHQHVVSPDLPRTSFRFLT